MEGSNNAIESKERATEVQNNSKKAIDETQKLYAEKENKMLKVIENGKVVDRIRIMADTIGIYQTNKLTCIKCSYRSSKSWRTRKRICSSCEEVRTLAEQSTQAVTIFRIQLLRFKKHLTIVLILVSDILNFINEDIHEQFNAYGETGNQYYNDSDIVSRY